MFTMKNGSIAALALLSGIQIANAADLPRRSDPYAPSVGYSASAPAAWQGFYAGLHLGGGWGESGRIDTSGLVGGLQGGYHFQFDRVVIGGEADVSFSSIGNSGYSEKADINWMATARARAGYSFGNILPYATLGAAFADTKYSNVYGRTTDTTTGWVIGAGAEMMVMPNVTVRAEYLRYEFGKQDYPVSTGTDRVDTHTNVVRAGVNYKF